MKKVIRIDGTGKFLEDVYIQEDAEIPTDCIDTPCPDGLFYKPKWDGESWVEGLSQTEIDALNNQLQEPTEIEKLKERLATAEQVAIETSITQQELLELLIEMEVI